MNEAIDIYHYDDYRRYLAARFEQRRQQIPRYSHRRFAAEAGFSNPGFLGDVIAGRRNLSTAAREKMVAAFGLNPSEAEYFNVLVAYNQAKKETQRQRHYQNLLYRRSRSNFVKLHPELTRYYQEPAYALIRNGLRVVEFRGEYNAFAARFNPPIALPLLKRCLRDLCEWGLVQVDETGRYQPTAEMVEPPQTLSHLVHELNKTWLTHAREAAERIPRNQRHFSTMLVTVSQQRYEEIQERIEAFRREILQLAENDPAPERLAQLSVQFFSRTENRGSDE